MCHISVFLHDQSAPPSAPEEAAAAAISLPSPSPSPSPSSGIMMISPMPDEGSCFTLLELAACDDLLGFVEHAEGRSLDTCCPWYCRQLGSNKMGMVDRTPLMIAAHHGSLGVLDYLVKRGVSINKSCGSDRSTALHLAVASGSENSTEVVNLLLKNGADLRLTDAQGLTPLDVFSKISKKKHHYGMSGKDVSNGLNALLTCFSMVPGENSVGATCETSPTDSDYDDDDDDPWGTKTTSTTHDNKQERLGSDPMPSDTNNHSSSVYYTSDAFRMYSFKILPCSRAYSHDWTECPFAHPGENARRRDPKKHLYSCVPCPDFRNGSCKHGDSCEYAHGVFETWLHPDHYRTRMCKDMGTCTRRVCFFAHSEAERRTPPLPKFSEDSSPRAPMSRLAPPCLGSGVAPMFPHRKGMFNGNLSFNVGPEIRPEIPSLAFNAVREIPLERGSLALSESAHVGASSFSAFRARKLEINLGQSLGPDDFFSNSLSPRSPLPMMPLPSSNLLHWEGLDHHKFGHNVDQNTLSMESESCFMSQPHHAHMALQYQHLHPSSMSPGSNLQMPSPYTCNGRGQIWHPYGSQSSKNLEGPFAWSGDWGSPNGKLEWGVSGDDLSKLRKSSSFQGARHNSTLHKSSFNGGPF